MACIRNAEYSIRWKTHTHTHTKESTALPVPIKSNDLRQRNPIHAGAEAHRWTRNDRTTRRVRQPNKKTNSSFHGMVPPRGVSFWCITIRATNAVVSILIFVYFSEFGRTLFGRTQCYALYATQNDWFFVRFHSEAIISLMRLMTYNIYNAVDSAVVGTKMLLHSQPYSYNNNMSCRNLCPTFRCSFDGNGNLIPFFMFHRIIMDYMDLVTQ